MQLVNRLLCGATLLVGTANGALAATPFAQPSAEGTQPTARLTPSLRELAVSAANIRALAAQTSLGPAPTLSHRFPDGTSTREAASLPSITETNVKVVAGPSLDTPPSGFTGITDGEFATLSGGELEPPDQGLAVNNGTSSRSSTTPSRSPTQRARRWPTRSRHPRFLATAPII